MTETSHVIDTSVTLRDAMREEYVMRVEYLGYRLSHQPLNRTLTFG